MFWNKKKSKSKPQIKTPTPKPIKTKEPPPKREPPFGETKKKEVKSPEPVDVYKRQVYEQLGIKRTKMSQTVGWIYKPEGNDNGDNFVDFGILETNRETEDGGYEKAILMEFNVDGPILDLI